MGVDCNRNVVETCVLFDRYNGKYCFCLTKTCRFVCYTTICLKFEEKSDVSSPRKEGSNNDLSFEITKYHVV